MELSVKSIGAATADALAPQFAAMLAVLQKIADGGGEKAPHAEHVIEKLKGDPNSARFVAGMTSLPFLNPEASFQLSGSTAAARAAGAGLRAGRFARAIACCRFEGLPATEAPKIIHDSYRDPSFAKTVEAELTKNAGTPIAKGLTATDPVAGGFLQGETFADDFIGVLRPETVMGRLGSRPYPMASAKVHIPRLDMASSFRWVGEAKRTPVTKPGTGRTTMTEHTAAAIVPISNALLRDSSPAADAVVRDDLIKVLKLGVDKTSIDGAGGEYSPIGLKYEGIQTMQLNAALDPDTITMAAELLESANVPMLNPGVFGNSKIKRDFKRLKSANGEYYYRDDLKQGKLEDFNWAMSNQIETGADQYGLTEFYMGDFSEHFTGERMNLGFSIDSSAEAAYYDGSDTQSAFQNLETLIRATYVTDFLVRHNVSFVRIYDVHTK